MKKILFILLITACGSNQNNTSQTSAFVTSDDATKALEITQKTTEYLPYAYLTDGCYARSFYMSMELAVEGIPSSSQYAICPDDACIAPDNVRWEWGYHVAPMIIVSSNPNRERLEPSYLNSQLVPSDLDDEHANDEDTNDEDTNDEDTNDELQPIVIDPAVSDEPLTKKEWVRQLNLDDRVVFTTRHGSEYDPMLRSRSNTQIARSIDDMPKFNKRDIISACETMWRYHLNTDLSLYRVNKNRELMIERTKYLLEELEKIDMLTLSHYSDYCGTFKL